MGTKIGRDVRRKNVEAIKILSSYFGGDFAKFLQNNLTKELSATINLISLFHNTILGDDDTLRDNARAALYQIFYDSLMDYIWYKAFGGANKIKSKIPIVSKGAITTGDGKLDDIIRDVFTNIAYSTKTVTKFQSNIEKNILDPKYEELGDDTKFYRLIEEGIFDFLGGKRGSDRQKTKKIIKTAISLVPKNLVTYKKIIEDIRGSYLNIFLQNITDPTVFVPNQYADALNKVAMATIVEDFFVKLTDKINSDTSTEVQHFYTTVVFDVLSHQTFEKALLRDCFSYFRQHVDKVRKNQRTGRKMSDSEKSKIFKNFTPKTR